MGFLKRAKIRYILHRYPIKPAIWLATLQQLKLLHRLSAVEKAHLRELSTRFIYYKQFIGIDLEISETMQALIAAQACLPILHLGLTLLDGWSEIVIYPHAFSVERDETDSIGVVHHRRKLLSGEAWYQGPLILSWQDIQHDIAYPDRGHNVVIHEIAHKLDMLNGRCNGMPPLHPDMPITTWCQTLTEAYQQLQRHLAHHHLTRISAYAARNPAEFFAVFSECFFSNPQLLATEFAAVYRQYQLYYRQNPLADTV